MSDIKIEKEDVGERIGEHLLDLISGGDGDSDSRTIDISVDGDSHGPGWGKTTWRKAF